MKHKLLPFVCVASVLGISLVFVWAYQALAAGSLFSYWKFDEIVPGSTVADSSGSGYDGTPFGPDGDQEGPQPSTELPPTVFANLRSLLFDGTDDYVDVSDWSADTSNGFTIALWARPTATKNWARFIDFGNGPGSDNVVFGRQGFTTDFFFEVYNGSSTTKVVAPCLLANGVWHHYAATIDADGNTVLYRDGIQVATGTTNRPLNIARTNKYIGRSNWGGDEYYEGYMDELRIYDRALTPAEMLELANGEEGPDATPTPTPAPSPSPTPTPTPNPVPNNGDANNDGIADAGQPNVSGLVSAVTNKYVAVAAPNPCPLSSVAIADARDNTVQDSGYSYPAGLLSYSADCGTPGYTATVKLYFYGVSPAAYSLRKYDPSTHGYAAVAGAAFSWEIIGGESVLVATYQATDGGVLDADGVANGVIVDPVGPAVQKVRVPNTGC